MLIKKTTDSAAGMGEDFNEEEAESFAKKHRNKRWYRDFMSLFEMLRESLRTGSGFTLTKQSILLISGVLVYVITPTDAIFDVVPFAGFLDDIAVMAAATYFLAPELERYQVHKEVSKE